MGNRMKAVAMLVVLGLVIVPIVVFPSGAGADESPVDFTLVPDPSFTSAVGDTFELTVMAVCGSQQINMTQGGLEFDPAYLTVTGITQGEAWDWVPTCTYDNTAGTVEFQTGMFGTYLSGDVVVATVVFETTNATSAEGTCVTFDASTGAAGPGGVDVTDELKMACMTIPGTISEGPVPPIPELSTILLAGVGAMGMGAYIWKKKRGKAVLETG